MEGYDLCPHCCSKLNEQQPDKIGVYTTLEYSCGNIVSIIENDKGEVIQTDNGSCEKKIEWENILQPYSGEFDESAKLVDERFFGWIELQFYKSLHSKNWINKNQEKQCTDKEFLDEYFGGKELYANRVREIESMDFYAIPVRETITKDYVDWIGEVTMEKVEEKTIESHGEEVQRIIYRVISSEDKKLEAGYVVEHNPVGGADKSRDFYYRDILDVILKKEG